ncbi:MAG: YidC/Oxa1 family membrane protein insertase [Candidatus Andersenbacteria bacterium]
MNIGTILSAIFVNPFLNLLIGLRSVMPGHDLGLAIIAVTIIVRLVLYPFSARQIRSQRAMQELQPRIDEIRAKHKDDREAQSKALLEFYRENKVSPLSSCGPLLIQTLLIYPLFFVFRMAITGADFGTRLYPFINHPALPINTHFLGIVDLAAVHNIPLAVLTAVAQFFQSWMLVRRNKKNQPVGPDGKPAKQDPSQALSNNLVYIFPLLTGYFAYTFPAGLALYWLASTLFAIGQQFIIMRSTASKPKDPTTHGTAEAVVVR